MLTLPLLPSCCSISRLPWMDEAFCMFGFMVVRLTRVTVGTTAGRMFGKTGAPDCVGDRLTLI